MKKRADKDYGCSDFCKSYGLSVSEVSELINKSTITILNWYRKNPDLLRFTLKGINSEKKEEKRERVTIDGLDFFVDENGSLKRLK